MTPSDNPQLASLLNASRLKKLTVEQIQQIDHYLAALEEYGEVHLIVERGVLKYINMIERHKAWKDDDKDEG